MKEFWAKMDAYKEAFGEDFPLYEMLGGDEKQIMGIIDKCIKDGKPYESKHRGDGVLY